MSESDRSDDPDADIIKDFSAFLRGKHTPEQLERVKKALEDPTSELNEHLRAHEEWAKQRFPLAGTSPPVPLPAPPVSRAKQRLDAVFGYIEKKLKEGAFTLDEVAAFGAAGPAAEDFSAPPLSPVECNALTVRILKAIEKAHPELKSELGAFRSDRRR